jgi:hypothetical protein
MPRSRRNRRVRVVFRGESDVLASAFPELTPEFDDGNTVLVGAVLDQAQLRGIIEGADSLGFDLVSLNPIDPTARADV